MENLPTTTAKERCSPPEPFFVVRPSTGEINCIKFQPSNSGSTELLFYGTSEGQLGVLDLHTMRVGWTWFTASKKSVLAVDVCDDNSVLSLCKESVVEVWDLCKQVKIEDVHLDNFNFCKFSALNMEGKWRFAVGCSEFGQVRIYSKGEKKPVLILKSETRKSLGTCMAVHYSQLESKPCQIIGGFENGSLINWDIRNPHHHLSGVQLYDEPITCMDYCPNSSFGVCGSPGNILKSFCCSENNLQLQNETVLKHSGQNDVSIRTDGKIFGSGGWDSRLRVFSCKKLKPLAVLEYHSDSITTVDFFPETSSSFSNVLAAGSRDRKITFWRIV